MRRNVGKTDRLVRAVLGVVLLAVLFLAEGPFRYIGLAGIVLLLTSFVSFCPLYTLFGLNTCPVPDGRR